MRLEPNATVAEHAAAIDGPAPPLHPVPGPPPVHGAQWDEVRGVWIRWIDDAWLVVEEHDGHAAFGAAVDEVVLPPVLAHALDVTRDEVVIDLTASTPVLRVPRPGR